MRWHATIAAAATIALGVTIALAEESLPAQLPSPWKGMSADLTIKPDMNAHQGEAPYVILGGKPARRIGHIGKNQTGAINFSQGSRF